MKGIDSVRRGRRFIIATVATAMAVTYVAVPSSADVPLGTDNFDAEDGNQVIDGTETDWVTLDPDPIFDAASGKGDNSLAGGTKDDTECPSTTTGSIPPQKDDLQHWYFDSQEVTASGETDVFFYLGYVREVGSDTASAHGVFELNQSATPCPDIPAKGNKPAIPSPFKDRTTDDVRLLFDYEGGDNPVISYQLWDDDAKTWSAPVTLPPTIADGFVNSGDITDVLNTGATLTNREFAEAKINMSAAGLIPEDECEPFAAAGLFTGASGNSDQEQSKDFIAPTGLPFNFCGDLQIEKYIDVDQSGTENTGDVVDSGSDGEGDLDGWAFKVFEDGADPLTATPVCSGTTNNEGVLLCEDLESGDYDVYETLAGDFINTDPGGSGPYKKDVTVAQNATTTVKFGNTCQITKTFEVTSVPSGTTGLLVWYDEDLTDNGLTAASASYVTMSASGGDYTGTASEKFDIGDAIEWGYGLDGNGDGDLEDVGDSTKLAGDETFAVADGYPDCLRENTTEFDDAKITIEKYKDVTGNGLTADDDPLGGWSFDLFRDDGDGTFDATTDTLVAENLTTEADDTDPAFGTVVQDGLAPGTYFVREDTQTNWKNTTPGGSGPYVIEVTVGIGGDGSAKFANAPLSRVKVEFEDLTGYTNGTIACTPAIGSGASSSSGETFETESTESSTVGTGTYTCTVTIVDP